MRAMLLETPRQPLRAADLPEPEPDLGQVRLSVAACGVCRTDLHVVDGELAGPKLPLVIGHQIVGTIAAVGPGVDGFAVGDRVGVPWLAWTCGDEAAQEFALELGARWAGDSTLLPPEPLDAAIIFAPVGALVPAALRALAPGGTVVCGGIHMTDIPGFPYSLLWEERTVRSVANLTRADAREFMTIASEIPVRTEVEVFPLADANQVLTRLRDGEVRGTAVLTVR